MFDVVSRRPTGLSGRLGMAVLESHFGQTAQRPRCFRSTPQHQPRDRMASLIRCRLALTLARPAAFFSLRSCLRSAFLFRRSAARSILR
jgi:hypothetical protein